MGIYYLELLRILSVHHPKFSVILSNSLLYIYISLLIFRTVFIFRAEVCELFIKGNKPKMATRTLPVLPEILITPTTDYYSEELSAIYAVRINNTVFIKESSARSLRHLKQMQEEKWHEACSSWLYYFNVPVKRVGRAKLFLQNLGTTSLRYCWKKIKEQIHFVSDDDLNQVFYFNKNEDVLSPGQSRDVYFTFVSSTVGIYNESWELGFVNVSFLDNLSKKLTVNLQADTVQDMETIRKKIDIVKVRLNRKAVRKLIKTLLNNAVETATRVEPQVCPYKQLLLESELFIMKNPICYYYQTEVMKLKDFYSEMMPGEIWDLSITAWRDVMMKKDFDDRMKYYNVLKQSYAELMKPWNETRDHLWLKHVSVKLILSQLANKFDEIYVELIDVIDDLKPFDRLSEIPSGFKTPVHSKIQTMVHMIFYMRMYDQIKMAIEACTGIVSSIDANRWIKFDFCQV